MIKKLKTLHPENLWQSIVEDLEALSSPNFRNKIAQARKTRKTIPSSLVKRKIN